MVTKIEGTNRATFHLSGAGDAANLGMPNNAGGFFSRADFLKAVADELDVIVIERSELPEVEVVDGQPCAGSEGHSISIEAWHTPAILREIALEALALAEYLDANPPMDEAQVEAINALSQMIRQIDGNHDKGAGALAEALIATGRVEVAP